mmetsp:Transcript_106547/g.179856  ORF Transcript_106547/g.179856 Transcript_106547/m.179856 type:complete len:89 (-) Transcript_106547:155-421(-)
MHVQPPTHVTTEDMSVLLRHPDDTRHILLGSHMREAAFKVQQPGGTAAVSCRKDREGRQGKGLSAMLSCPSFVSLVLAKVQGDKRGCK